MKTQSSQDKDISRNKINLKNVNNITNTNVANTSRDDYTPRETIKNFKKKEGLKLPSPLRVKNYLRIKKPNSIVDSRNLEESKLPTVAFTSMASAVKSGEEKFRKTSIGGTTNKFRGSSHIGFGSGEPRISAYATILSNDKNYESLLKEFNATTLDSASTFNV